MDAVIVVGEQIFENTIDINKYEIITLKKVS